MADPAEDIAAQIRGIEQRYGKPIGAWDAHPFGTTLVVPMTVSVMPVQAGSRWSQRPRLISTAAARKTSRARYSRPRQRRSDQAVARCPIDCSTRARSPAWQRL